MNNRELATFIILGGLLTLALLSGDLRSTLKGLATQLFASKLTAVLAAYVLVIGGAVWAASRLGIWSTALLGATLLWFLFTGFAWFVSLPQASEDPDFFKPRFIEALGIAAFFEFFLNAQVLSLPIEIFGQLAVTFIVLLNVAAMQKQEHKPVAQFTSVILAITSGGLLTYTVIKLASTWPSVDKSALANELLMPIWLAVAVIPFLYCVAFHIGYQALFRRLRFMNDRKSLSVPAKLGIMLGLRGALVDVGTFTGSPAHSAARSRSIRSALGHVQAFKTERAAEQAARNHARLQLELNAGKFGVDDAGLVIDRREFAETKNALRWLSVCHMGWYRQEGRPDEYRSDLLDMLISTDSEQLNFGVGNPVITKVRKDKQAWYAYRETPSGHVFGIGASGPPPSQWFFDGPVPPSGYPSAKSAGWTDWMEPDGAEWRSEPAT